MFHYFNISFVSSPRHAPVNVVSNGNRSARDTQGMRKG